MKKLRIFGMLVTVMLLAFGLSLLSCGSDSEEEIVDPGPSGPVLTGEYLRFTGTDSQDRSVEVIFRQVQAAARYAPATGDRYEINLNGSTVSSGRVVISNQRDVEFIPEPNGDRFYGTISGTTWLAIDTISSTGGAITGFTSQFSTPGVINPGAKLTYSVAQSGGAAGSTPTSSLVFTFNAPFADLKIDDISIIFSGAARDGVAVPQGFRFDPDPTTRRLSPC